MTTTMTRTRPRGGCSMKTPRPVDREIARLREIVTNSSDAMIFGGGEITPDEALLDICAEALHLFSEARKIRAEAELAYVDLDKMDWQSRQDSPADRKWRQLNDDAYEATLKAKPLLRRLAKLRAITAAGIYAKALVVQASVTGAAGLAKSMAEDFIANKELRASIWPAEREDALSR